MNIRRIEHEFLLYRMSAAELEDIQAELEGLKSYDRPKTGEGKKAGVPDVADQVIARDRRKEELQTKAKTIRRRRKAVEAALRQYKKHEYIDAVKRIYVQGQSVRLVAKDMRRDWRTVDRHARQLLCQMGEIICKVGNL